MRDEELDRIVLSLDGRPLGRTAPHGGRIDWLPGADAVAASPE